MNEDRGTMRQERGEQTTRPTFQYRPCGPHLIDGIRAQTQISLGIRRNETRSLEHAAVRLFEERRKHARAVFLTGLCPTFNRRLVFDGTL